MIALLVLTRRVSAGQRIGCVLARASRHAAITASGLLRHCARQPAARFVPQTRFKVDVCSVQLSLRAESLVKQFEHECDTVLAVQSFAGSGMNARSQSFTEPRLTRVCVRVPWQGAT